MVKRKVIVIGLDGADWRLLDPWIRAGYLPTLSNLVTEGLHGRLRSTIRPESSVAWTSFSTGVNPGKHGVFGFAKYRMGSYSFRIVNALSVHIKRFWDILGEHGIRVGIVNVPLTYPPSPINGFMVTGMLTPGPEVNFTYPRDLRLQLLKRFDNYMFDVNSSATSKAELVSSVHAYTLQQRETALFLLQQPWDFFAIVFTGPDRLQHFLWSEMDPHHPFHVPESAQVFGNALLEHYQVLDSAIAAILEQTPSDSLVLLMSDHGFNGCARRFYINQWLREQGLLVPIKTSEWSSRLVASLSSLRANQWLRRLKRTILPDRWTPTELRSAMFAHAIDWLHTKVYFGLDGGLRINLKGREPQGIVHPGDEYEALRQELRHALLSLRDPQTHLSPLAGVYFREDLYWGEHVDKAPDLILEPQRDALNPQHNFVLDNSLELHKVESFGSSAPYSGNHSLDGILIAWGADVVAGSYIEGAQIIDIAPTVLTAMGIDIPEYMDGKILSEISRVNGTVTSQKVKDTAGTKASQTAEKGFSLEEELTIEKRLRDLGYLD